MSLLLALTAPSGTTFNQSISASLARAATVSTTSVFSSTISAAMPRIAAVNAAFSPWGSFANQIINSILIFW